MLQATQKIITTLIAIIIYQLADSVEVVQVCDFRVHTVTNCLGARLLTQRYQATTAPDPVRPARTAPAADRRRCRTAFGGETVRCARAATARRTAGSAGAGRMATHWRWWPAGQRPQ